MFNFTSNYWKNKFIGFLIVLVIQWLGTLYFDHALHEYEIERQNNKQEEPVDGVDIKNKQDNNNQYSKNQDGKNQDGKNQDGKSQDGKGQDSNNALEGSGSDLKNLINAFKTINDQQSF